MNQILFEICVKICAKDGATFMYRLIVIYSKTAFCVKITYVIEFLLERWGCTVQYSGTLRVL